MTIHKTTEGETWDYIAKKYYRDERFMHVLLEANSEYRNYSILPAYLEVVIPDIDIAPEEEDLPPWKK